MIHFAMPLYLLGGLLIGVPVILHFLKRKPKTVQRFPSFFFLHRTLIVKQKRNNIRKWLVLLFRCLAILALALGFAYPFFSETALMPKHATVILVDGSYSLENWKEEVRLAVFRELEQCSAEHPVLIGGVTTRCTWSGDFTGHPGELKAFTRKLLDLPPAQTSSFQLALQAADSRLAGIQAKRREIVVITDHQKLPWETFDASRKLKHTGELRVHSVLSGLTSKRANLAITQTGTRDLFTAPGQTLTQFAEIQNFSDREASVELALILNEKVQAVHRHKLAPRGRIRDEFSFNAPGEWNAFAGSFRLKCAEKELNELHCDDERFFAFNPVKPPRIELVSGESPHGGFIAEALPVHLLSPENLSGAADADLLILEEIPAGKSEVYRKLAEEQMRNGGTCVVLWKNTPDTAALLERFGFRARKKQIPGTHRLETLQFDHPLFRSYLKVNAGSWFDILFFSVPHLTVPETAEVLAEFDHGIPGLLEMKSGKGKLFVLAARPEADRTNWQTFANFLPFWREMAYYAAKSEDRTPELIADGSKRTVAGGKGLLTLDRAGNTRIGERCYTVNLPVREADLTALDPGLNPAAILNPKVRQDLLKSWKKQDHLLNAAAEKKSCWRLLLLLALLFALAELALANRTVR